MTDVDIDKHSVNCYFCGELVDERECTPADDLNEKDGGSCCQKCREKRTNVDWGVACGKHYLKVRGFVTVIIGNQCYDGDLCKRFKSDRWTEEMIKWVGEGNCNE